jgi:hypothetical protein
VLLTRANLCGARTCMFSPDADGDAITVANDSDLAEAIAWATGTLKLHVCRTTKCAEDPSMRATSGAAGPLAGQQQQQQQQQQQPLFTPVASATFGLDPSSAVGAVIGRVVQHFCLPLPLSNPKILEMFRDRDRQPPQPLLPWSGEFVGKYLTHCVQLYKLTATAELGAQIKACFTTLASYQQPDGYMGPFPSGFEFQQHAPNCDQPWDSVSAMHAAPVVMLLLTRAESARGLALLVSSRISCKV